MTDPFASGHHSDLLRAFRHQDDHRGRLQDVRAALPAAIVTRTGQFGLAAVPDSLTEYQAARVELQYLLTWREGSLRNVLVDDVQVREGGQVGENTIAPSLLTLTARPRTLKGLPVRGVGACSLTCHHYPAILVESNPLAIQHRFYAGRTSYANRNC